MTEKVLHIVEPTLESEAGHCHSFVESFCRAGRNAGWSLRLFSGFGARLPELEAEGVRVLPLFLRRLRRIQAFFLYRRLLREEGRIFVPTATRIDLLLLSLAAGGAIPPRKVFLYFHWFRPDDGKRKFLRRIARRQPDLAVLAPTGSVVGVFRECGYGSAREAPYPITPVDPGDRGEEVPFRHLLFAGAARMDKGFSKVVDLVELMRARGMEMPVSVQASPDHYGRVDPEVRGEIDRLGRIGYPRLETRTGTLGEREYPEQFRGAVCLQPYDPADFADRVSGVTLDALSRGCPVVTLKGTWMGRVVERFEAGLAVEDASPQRLLAAVEEIVAGYGRYRGNALRAGDALQRELGAGRLFGIVTG